MDCGAGPAPLLGRLHHAGAHRVQLGITQRGPEMRLVERAGIESALPHVARGTLVSVSVGGVTSVRVLESFRQGGGRPRHSDQVHVVGHQAVTQQ